MLQIIACVTQQHNLWLVLLAALICVLGAAATFFVLDFSANKTTERAERWRLTAAVMSAGTTWATHFVAMLAYDPGLPVSFSLGATVLSAVVGLGGSILAFEIYGRIPGLRGRLAAGAMLGGAISALHYLGMAGLEIGARRVWDVGLVASSAIVSMIFAACALEAASRADKRLRLFAATGLLVLSICALHFTGMGALTLVPDPMVQAAQGSLDRLSLASLVAICIGAVLAMALIMSFGERRLTALKLRQARRIQRLADASQEGIIFHDGATISDANIQFAKMLGCSVDDVLGLPVSTLLPKEDIAEIGDQLRAKMKATIETTIRGPAGSVEVEIYTRLDDNQGRLFISSFRDISARRRAETAERANTEKSQFLANMSHELRTPLNAIIGYAEILQEDANDREDGGAAHDAERIKHAGKHLLSLINEILDLSKIEAGKIEINIAEADLAEIAAEVVATVRAQAEAKNNSISLTIAPGLSEARTDAFRLKQCLLNLMSNAVKFTENGKVTLEMRPLDSATGRLEIRISDTGIGMTSEQMSRLFQPFTQADASISQRFGGTGLGLVITQRLITMLGGAIRMESELGVGTTFVITLPLASEEPAARAHAA